MSWIRRWAHSIAGRLVIWFLMIGLIPCIIMAWFLFSAAVENLRDATMRSLNLLLNSRIEALDTYTQERLREVDVISKGPSIVQLLGDYKALAAEDPAARLALDERARTVLGRFLETIGHANALLLSPDCKVLFSHGPGFAAGQDLRDGLFRDTPLSRSLSLGLSVVPPTISHPDFYPNLDGDRPLVFVNQTVHDDKQLMGLLVFELDPKLLDQIFAKTVIEDQDCVVYAGRALGNEAVILTTLPGETNRAGVETRFVLGESQAPSLQAAVKGRRGSAETVDRLGRPSVVAWGHEKTLDLGIVAEIETSSAFRQIRSLERLTWVAIALAALLIITAALIAARTIAVPIRRLIRHVQESIVSVVSSATQIAATAREQERVAEEHGASMASVASAVNEISATSGELMRLMGRAQESASHVSSLTSIGRSGLTQMHQEMQALAASTEAFGSRLAVISERASKINLAVTTIVKVADQTNLLSVNAAIEAEKAGEFGRGFLVVAREIRRLADQTAAATLDIERIVKDMQQGVTSGVMQMDKFHEQVRIGVSNVDHISSRLGEVIDSVGALLPELQRVNEGTSVQALGAEQIREAMGNLEEGAARTYKSIRESHQASEALRDSIGRLQEDIARVPT